LTSAIFPASWSHLGGSLQIQEIQAIDQDRQIKIGAAMVRRKRAGKIGRLPG